MTGAPSPIRAVIFDLDGVLVTTDELHFRAWSELAEREGIPFTRHDNERLRGVDRMRSLDIILEKAARPYTPEQKAAMAASKNARYRELLGALTSADALPGARDTLERLRERAVKTAVGSSSRNARDILRLTGLEPLTDVIVDGNDVTHAKPDPEVFILAAQRLGLRPADCLVVEDGAAGIEAAIRGGFPVLGIGEPERLGRLAPNRCVANLGQITIDRLLNPGVPARVAGSGRSM